MECGISHDLGPISAPSPETLILTIGRMLHPPGFVFSTINHCGANDIRKNNVKPSHDGNGGESSGGNDSSPPDRQCSKNKRASYPVRSNPIPDPPEVVDSETDAKDKVTMPLSRPIVEKPNATGVKTPRR